MVSVQLVGFAQALAFAGVIVLLVGCVRAVAQKFTA